MCVVENFVINLGLFWPSFFSFLVNSTCSTGSKYDVDLLRADVGQCKARVQKLKRELVNMDAEVCIKQKGMETLARVKDKYSEENNGLTLEEARAIKAELNNIQKSLTVGEQEKIDLMKNLACLKDDLTRLQHSDSTLDVSKQSQMMERLSTASQTDLSGEVRHFSPLFSCKNHFSKIPCVISRQIDWCCKLIARI